MAFPGLKDSSHSKWPFKIGTTSMVFGDHLRRNVQLLNGLVDHIEIVLFHTPSIHNIPNPQEIRMLKRIREQEGITFTVHLPASIELANPDKGVREGSVRIARQICLRTAELDPVHYILHIPFTSPTLVPVPGLYFTVGHGVGWEEWRNRALDSLGMLYRETGIGGKLLVENINYSPTFLEPFWREGLCGFCMDLGHLMLGREDVMACLKRYLDVTGEVHLHGVRGDREHLSLSILPGKKVLEWRNYLIGKAYRGVVILEVFSGRDLTESMDVLCD